MGKIKVLVVDDSALARDLLRSFLESDSDIEVVGEAKNGEEGVRLAVELKPDLVTMDLEMPVMGGMEAIAEIMATRAVPILVVSSVNDAKNAYAAVARGALDAMNKPELDATSGEIFVAKVKMLSQIRVITHMRSRFPATPSAAVAAPLPTAKPLVNQMSRPPNTVRVEPAAAHAPVNKALLNKVEVLRSNVLHASSGHSDIKSPPNYQRIFAIVSSTGGPQALALILGLLPADFPCPILISQHISDGFAPGMAQWLASICKLPVRLAQEGEMVMPGTVHISPSEANLAVTPSRRITLVPRQPGEIYHPTCDVLLGSVAAVYGHQSIGIILTGMGNDGAQGIEEIRQAGGATLAQDEASSVVFGMNKVAIDRGGVQQVLPVDRIPQAMRRLAGLSV